MKRGLSTKESILGRATEMFATQGFDETKIADIAVAVGISDSTIYEHYRNKEEILLPILRERTRHLVATNERHLRGLVGAEVKLRKLVWNYLEFLTDRKEYTSLILFEVRRNRSFYRGEIFRQIRSLTKMFGDAVREGQAAGLFHPSLPPYLVLNMIFGTIDHLLLTWLSCGNPRDPLACFDPLFDLFSGAIRLRSGGDREEDKRKTRGRGSFPPPPRSSPKWASRRPGSRTWPGWQAWQTAPSTNISRTSKSSCSPFRWRTPES